MTKLNPTPEVNCRYGAPMGRASHPNEFSEQHYTVMSNAPPMYLVRCPLDRGGYDRGGAYWGLGEPLYYYEAHLTDIRGYVRGRTRQHAKVAVLKIHPNARFFR
jgi:hypothetical protein